MNCRKNLLCGLYFRALLSNNILMNQKNNPDTDIPKLFFVMADGFHNICTIMNI
jgi:hypothetical protein